MRELNQEALECAKINFENFEKACPMISQHPFWIIAKAQLDEGLGYIADAAEVIERKTRQAHER